MTICGYWSVGKFPPVTGSDAHFHQVKVLRFEIGWWGQNCNCGWGVKDLHISSLLNLEYFIHKTSVKCIVIVQLTSSLQNVSQNCSHLRHTHLVLAKSGPIIVTFGQSVTMSTFKLVQYSNGLKSVRFFSSRFLFQIYNLSVLLVLLPQ